MNGFHHVTLTVSDLDSSLGWYRDVLGLRPVQRLPLGGLDKVVLSDAAGTVTLGLIGHGEAARRGPACERIPGLDHVAFAVPDRRQLEAWRDRLEEHGVAHSGISRGARGELIVFRDPDNIQLELYALS